MRAELELPPICVFSGKKRTSFLLASIASVQENFHLAKFQPQTTAKSSCRCAATAMLLHPHRTGFNGLCCSLTLIPISSPQHCPPTSSRFSTCGGHGERFETSGVKRKLVGTIMIKPSTDPLLSSHWIMPDPITLSIPRTRSSNHSNRSPLQSARQMWCGGVRHEAVPHTQRTTVRLTVLREKNKTLPTA